MPRCAQVFDQGLWAAAGGAVATSNVWCWGQHHGCQPGHGHSPQLQGGPGLQEAPYIRGSATCLPFVLSKHSSAVFVLEECWLAWMKNKTPSPCLFRVAVIFLYMVQVVGARVAVRSGGAHCEVLAVPSCGCRGVLEVSAAMCSLLREVSPVRAGNLSFSGALV